MPDCLPFLYSFKRTLALLKDKGYEAQKGMVFGDPYIQKARNTLAKKFLDSDCDCLFFLADDLEWDSFDALRVIEADGEVICGAYPQKFEPIKFPVFINKNAGGIPIIREDGCVSARRVQTGFLRIDRVVFENIIKGYPELSFYGVKDGVPVGISHDFFPQGVRNHRWIGEDYAFCDLWTGLDGKIWIVPDMKLTHWKWGKEKEEQKGYDGNYYKYLKESVGGSNGNS